MTESNTINLVRDRNSSDNRFFVILMSVLGVVIVGLIVAIVMVNIQSRGNGYYNGQAIAGLDSATDADNKYNEIISKLESDDGYSEKDAVNEFETALSNGSDMWKSYIAIYFAGFVYDRYKDAEWSVRIMENVQNIVPENTKPVFDAILAQYKTIVAEGNNEKQD